MASSLCPDRAIIAVDGDDAEALLNRLFTKGMLAMDDGAARYAALLSPQGKLLFDFLVYRHRGAFWIDVATGQAADLARKLTMFRLRAKVSIEVREDLAVVAQWGEKLFAPPGVAFRDPRHDALGYRIVAAPDQLREFDEAAAAYAAHRIALGVPEGGIDFVYGDAFVHDANIDLMHGVDFDKGCYVGQEVVSRVHHRGSARKRIVKLAFYGDAPAVGADITAGTVQLGRVTSLHERNGLAMARIDRLDDAERAKIPVLSGETLVTITLPTGASVGSPRLADDVV